MSKKDKLETLDEMFEKARVKPRDRLVGGYTFAER